MSRVRAGAASGVRGHAHRAVRRAARGGTRADGRNSKLVHESGLRNSVRKGRGVVAHSTRAVSPEARVSPRLTATGRRRHVADTGARAASGDEMERSTMTAMQDGLIWTMVLASAANRDLTKIEIDTMQDLVAHLPVFRGFKVARLPTVTEACATVLAGRNGLDKVAARIKQAVPRRLGETAYALACDIIAAEGHVDVNEIGVLDLLAELFSLDSLTCAALEAGARARYARA
ncbi:MAG: tellurite resistance TerB family protein [Rhodospirillales bacterium]|nr:MAG: tellurite resistance TerB family protein [Rhodospirillales bacterium]